jgi:hypothetical protein
MVPMALMPRRGASAASGRDGGVVATSDKFEVVASFNAARAAWETYCQHLDGHGLLQPALKGRTAG